jgi:hypothetical protein
MQEHRTDRLSTIFISRCALNKRAAGFADERKFNQPGREYYEL